MTTTNIAKREERAIASEGAGVAGLSGEFGQQDVTLPICSIVQPMSQDKGEAGKFWFPDGTSIEQLSVVVLDIVATRALWAPISDTTVDGPLCRSADRVMGLTSDAQRVAGVKGEGEQYIVCKDCPHFKDAFTFVEGSEDPMCRYNYTLLMYERELQSPFLFFVKGSAMKPVKQRIVSPALQRYQRGGKAAPWSNPFTWTVQPKVDGKKNWFQPDIMPGEPFETEEAEFYADMAMALSGRAAQQSVEDPIAEEDAQPEMPLDSK